MKVINKLNEYFLGEPDEVYWQIYCISGDSISFMVEF